VQTARDPQRTGDPETLRQAEQSLTHVELVILARIDDVETGGPERDSGGEQQAARVERVAHGDPGSRRSDAKCKSQKMRVGSDREDERRAGDESPGEGGAEQAGRNMPHPCARIASIDLRIQDAAVDRALTIATTIHRMRQLSRPVKNSTIAPGDQYTGQSKGKRKDTMLELGHFEREPGSPEERAKWQRYSILDHRPPRLNGPIS
jgi:hypothetical protein